MELDKIKFSELVHWIPKQKQAHNLLKKVKFLLYGGAMGGGKSYWIRWELLWLLLYYHAKYGLKNVMVGLFCEDYPALKDRHLSKVKFEFPEWLGTYKVQDHNFILRPDYGSGVLAFRNLDDPSKYQSAEFASEGVDELTKNLVEMFNFLRTRLRWPGIPTIDCKFIAGTNPGGIGHGWVKRRWIDKDFPPEEKEAHLFAFIPAKVRDNPHLTEGYLDTLRSLPDDLRKAFEEGDWDLFRGQYFKEWRKEIHVCEPFEIPRDWKKILMGDYGYVKPSAIYWGAIDPDGILYLYRELYETGLLYSDLAKRIIGMTPDDEELDYWVWDPSSWATRGETELSGVEIMEQTYKEKTKKEIKILRGNNDRMSGWKRVREYLKPLLRRKEKIAKLQVFSTCHNFIRTFPALVHDSVKVEDVDKKGEDHAGDSVRYGIMTKPQKKEKKRKLKQPDVVPQSDYEGR